MRKLAQCESIEIVRIVKIEGVSSGEIVNPKGEYRWGCETLPVWTSVSLELDFPAGEYMAPPSSIE